MPVSDRGSTIGIDQIFEAAAAGVLRGMRAREISAERLVASGFTIRIDLIAGGFPLPLLTRGLARAELNPQPLPPGEISGSAGE